MATSTITNTIKDASGAAVSGVTVVARLKPGPAFRTSDSSEIAGQSTTTTNGSGVWTLALEQQANITPAGSWWEIEEQIADSLGGRKVWAISVGNTNATVLASQISPPPAGAPLFLTQTAGDGRYVAKASLAWNVKDSGAVGDGTTDDKSAIQAADTAAAAAGMALMFPPSRFYIANSVTIASDVIMQPGAVLVIPTGVTVTFNGKFTAPIRQVFTTTGTGAVVFGAGACDVGYGEWWGAGIGVADSLPGLQAAVDACGIVQLLGGDYVTSGTLYVHKDHRTIRGAHFHYIGAAPATRIVVSSATASVVVVTPATTPSPVTDSGQYVHNFEMRDVDLWRTVAPAPAAAGAETSGPCGLVLEYTFWCYIERVQAVEHSIGFCVNGTIQTHLKDCHAFRSLVGTGANTSNDWFWGFFFNGDQAANIGAAGGNASSYLIDCLAYIGGSPALTGSAGLRLTTGWADTFVTGFETSACQFGIYGTGTKSGTTGAQKTGNADLHINGCILDGFTSRGIYLKDIADYGAVNIADCYAAPASAAIDAGACYQIDTSVGQVSITGCQGICWPHPLVIGIYVTNSSGVTSKNNLIVGSQRPIVYTTASLCSTVDSMRAPAEANIADGAVTFTGDCTRCYAQPNISAGAAGGSTFPIAVMMVGSTNTYNEVNCTLIDPAGITSGAANKLVINGVQVTTAGLSGTNLASGVMA